MEQKIFAILAIVGFFVGTFPTGWLIVKKLTGKNLANDESGSLGAAHVKRFLDRELGKKKITGWYGRLTILGDAAKGALVIGLGYLFGVQLELLPILGILVLIGNCFNPFFTENFNFKKSGKGVSTVLGVGLTISWLPTLLGLAVWIFVRKFKLSKKYSSLAAIIGVPSIMLFSWLFHDPLVVQSMFGIFAIIVLYKHKDNIKRLLAGTETKTSDD